MFLQDQPGTGLGVVDAVRQLRARAHGALRGAVFTAKQPVSVEEAASLQALTTDTMRARLRKTLQQIGVQEVELFGFHSFRRGGATAAHLGQVSERQIMVHGRWKSDCVRKYMYLTAQDEQAWGVVGGMHQQKGLA